MAENGGNGGNGDSDTFGFLTRKIGPLPIWAWGALAVGAYYIYTHYIQPGQTAAQTAPTTTEKVVSSGGPSVSTVHISHERPTHKRKHEDKDS